MKHVSDILGYASIGCWLVAQFPQLFENMRRQSTEGLAIPLLVNWLLGDVSNLVGCLLTHQLPFQTWLASYFVFIDAVLFTQLCYYRRPKHLTHPSFGHSHSRTASATVRRRSADRPHYRTLSAVAANVATAAALAAQQEEEVDAQYVQNRRRIGSVDDRLHQSQGRHIASETVEDDTDENAVTALTESFHSEVPSPSARKRVSWSTERHSMRGGSVGRNPNARGAIPSFLQTAGTEPPAQYVDQSRGRPLEREDPDTDLEPESVGERRSSRASRRGAGMVFLGVWAIIGVGTLVGTGPDILVPSGRSTNVGSVLYPEGPSIPVTLSHRAIPRLPSVYDGIGFVHVDEQSLQDNPSYHDDPPNKPPSSERILGRIFAWLCATLYMTSRLPQIWKNFVRKSVEGLSMYLFTFAFLGNTFYVASILSSPELSIRESIPFLLGSGGTILFDMTIITQSFIYRPLVHRGRQRLARSRSRMLGEEEEGLLSGDGLAHPRLGSDDSRMNSARNDS